MASEILAGKIQEQRQQHKAHRTRSKAPLAKLQVSRTVHLRRAVGKTSYSTSRIDRRPKRLSKVQLVESKFGTPGSKRPGKKPAVSFQNKLVVIEYMGTDAPRQIGLKETYVVMRGMLADMSVESDENTVRNTYAMLFDLMTNTASSYQVNSNFSKQMVRTFLCLPCLPVLCGPVKLSRIWLEMEPFMFDCWSILMKNISLILMITYLCIILEVCAWHCFLTSVTLTLGHACNFIRKLILH